MESTCVICLLSWLPRKRVMLAGYLALRSIKKVNVSTLLYPRSTKSPCTPQSSTDVAGEFISKSRRHCPILNLWDGTRHGPPQNQVWISGRRIGFEIGRAAASSPPCVQTIWFGVCGVVFGGNNEIQRKNSTKCCTIQRETTVSETYHEHIGGRGDLFADLEELEQVIKLAMDIAAHRHRCLHRLDVALFN